MVLFLWPKNTTAFYVVLAQDRPNALHLSQINNPRHFSKYCTYDTYHEQTNPSWTTERVLTFILPSTCPCLLLCETGWFEIFFHLCLGGVCLLKRLVFHSGPSMGWHQTIRDTRAKPLSTRTQTPQTNLLNKLLYAFPYSQTPALFGLSTAIVFAVAPCYIGIPMRKVWRCWQRVVSFLKPSPWQHPLGGNKNPSLFHLTTFCLSTNDTRGFAGSGKAENWDASALRHQWPSEEQELRSYNCEGLLNVQDWISQGHKYKRSTMWTGALSSVVW